MASPSRDRTALAAFLAMVTVAGGNAVAIRYISCEGCELDPFWSAAFRFLMATAIFTVVAIALRTGIPRGRALVGTVLYGALTFGAGFAFIYVGLERAPASIGGVLLATGPLLTFLLAVAHRQETFRWHGLIGAALALGGTAVVFQSGLDKGVPFGSLAAIVAGSACWAEASILVKAFPKVHPASMNAVGMGIGTAMLLVLTAIFGESYVIPDGRSTWTALAYLVTLGSVGVFALYLFVLGRWKASAVSYEFVLIPLVGIVLSAWLLDERITWAFVAGTGLVLLGVYLGAIRQPVPATIEPSATPLAEDGR